MTPNDDFLVVRRELLDELKGFLDDRPDSEKSASPTGGQRRAETLRRSIPSYMRRRMNSSVSLAVHFP